MLNQKQKRKENARLRRAERAERACGALCFPFFSSLGYNLLASGRVGARGRGLQASDLKLAVISRSADQCKCDCPVSDAADGAHTERARRL